MAQINWGIIGCGNVTEIKSGPAFNKVKNSSLAAVMRRNAEKARDYAERHQVPKWYDNAADLINDKDVDAVYIATPPSLHETYAIAVMQAGKPVYLEKPMSTDSLSAKRIADAAKKYGSKLCIAHYRRQLPIFKKIKELIDSGYIGDIKLIQLQLLQSVNEKGFEPGPQNWRLDPSVSGGGFFHDLSPHQLDLLYHYFGVPEYCNGISFNQAGLYAADDIVAGTIGFNKGVVMNGVWNFTVPENEARDHCEIIGSLGSMRFSIFTMHKVTVTRNGMEEIIHFDPVPHVQQPMIEKVVEYFLDQGSNPCPGDEGVAVMQMIDAFTKK